MQHTSVLLFPESFENKLQTCASLPLNISVHVSEEQGYSILLYKHSTATKTISTVSSYPHAYAYGIRAMFSHRMPDGIKAPILPL